MSTLKVNELDTESGTTITIAAGKTLAGTNIIDASALENNSVVSDTIADNQVTLAKMAGLVRGKLIVGDASGDPSALTVGAADQVLMSDGSDATWSDLSTGTSWQAVQTAAFTAVAGNGYPINTTAAAITMTLPASASVGDTIEVVDYAGTFDTNKVTVNPNGLKIKGDTLNVMLNMERLGVRMVYIDATQGWNAVTSRSAESITPLFVVTGGTVTTNGLYTVHTFTSSGNAVVQGDGTVEILCIAGAGGGASQHSGGGGAGGYRYITGVAVSTQTYSIVVGGGGAGGGAAASQMGVSGTPSSGLSYTSAGGGGGGTYPAQTGLTGGSGGGGGTNYGAGGAGNTPSTTPAQGFAGGNASTHSPSGGAGGGGGSAAVGAAGTTSVGGVGGAGTLNNLDGNGYYWAGGGGGAGHVTGTTGGAGGIGGGGGGGNYNGAGGAAGGGPSINAGGAGGTGNPSGGAGGANTGSGGGGSGANTTAAGNGGSGIVIIRYLT